MKYLLQGCTKKEAELRAKPRKSNDQRDRGRQAKKERGQIKVKKERIYIYFFNNVDIFHKNNQFRKDGPKPERKKRAPKQEKKNRKGGREITWWVITKELKVWEQIQC